jgi:Icc-related predicted phosphoesterase
LKVKILILSDIHSQNITLLNILHSAKNLKKPPTHCLIAGDITNFGTIADMDQILNTVNDYFKNVFFVIGNCDPYAKNKEFKTKAINVESKIQEIEFFKIIGFGTHKPELKQKLLNKLKKSKDKVCLLTHVPPHNTQADMVSLNRHIGSIELRKFVEKNSHIFLVVSGHIHNSPTITKLNECTVVNPGPVTIGNFAIIEVDSDFKIEGKIYNLYEM